MVLISPAVLQTGKGGSKVRPFLHFAQPGFLFFLLLLALLICSTVTAATGVTLR